MKTLGIISEFNPFHNGHEYLLEKSKEVTGADTAITIMSGDFVQRGEAALMDKFVRSDIAMKAGFDMVVEMPVHITLQSAEYFALGSIKILDKIGIDYLCFGIENIAPDKFLDKVNILIEKKDELEDLTKAKLKDNSFTKARYDATVEILDDSNFITSNNILALEYIRAIDKIGSNIKPVPIRRISSINSDKNLRDSNISSSTAIRKNIFDDYKSHVPSYSYEAIEKQKKDYGIDVLGYEFDLIRYLLLVEKKDMDQILGYEEGIENYLSKIAEDAVYFNDFIEKATTKRYTQARIKRLLLNYILDNKSKLNSYDIGFYKVLAFNQKGGRLFKNSKSNPLMTKKDTYGLSQTDQVILEKMIDASNLYKISQWRETNQDFKKKIRRY